MKKEVAQKITSKAISNVNENPLVVKENGCAAACHVLFNLSKEMEISEQDASEKEKQYHHLSNKR
jgi:uncharacterized protein YpmB